MAWGRDKIGKVAQELADHLQLIENVKALQQGQKEIAKAVSLLGERILAMETEMRALRAEVKFDALKETQQMINAVQGGFNDKLTDVTVRISHLEAQRTSQSPLITFKAGTVRSEDSDKPAA